MATKQKPQPYKTVNGDVPVSSALMIAVFAWIICPPVGLIFTIIGLVRTVKIWDHNSKC